MRVVLGDDYSVQAFSTATWDCEEIPGQEKKEWFEERKKNVLGKQPESPGIFSAGSLLEIATVASQVFRSGFSTSALLASQAGEFFIVGGCRVQCLAASLASTH